jgi:hypothetical protein
MIPFRQVFSGQLFALSFPNANLNCGRRFGKSKLQKKSRDLSRRELEIRINVSEQR